MQSLKIAATGMTAQQMRVDVISNNLANMSTTGYNARRAEFADLHYQQLTSPGAINASDGTILPTGVQIGLGVRPSSITMSPQQGSLTATGGDLDVAIEGDGYFEVTLPSGTSAFTRDGALKISPDELIVTSDGYPVVPDITIPDDARSLSITPDGEVHAYFDGEVEPEQLGEITLADFSNEKGLEAVGSNLFLESAASGPPFIATPGEDGIGTLRQGYLEDSSVDAVREITELIQAQRGYELNAKVISAADQMLGATTQADPMTYKFLLLAGMLAATAHLAAAETLIARHTIRSRAVLTEDDIDVVPEFVAGALSNPDEAIGMEARVVLYSGRPIRQQDLQLPALVERNQIVTLVYQSSGLSILTEGRSLARASAGERIRAMNLASRSTVTGTVTPSGQVVVGPTGHNPLTAEHE